MATYRVLAGVDYAGKRAERGDIVNDLPQKSIPWLTAQGIVEPTSDKPEPTSEPTQSPRPASKGDK